jgi:hypothetical protein
MKLKWLKKRQARNFRPRGKMAIIWVRKCQRSKRRDLWGHAQQFSASSGLVPETPRAGLNKLVDGADPTIEYTSFNVQ